MGNAGDIHHQKCYNHDKGREFFHDHNYKQ
jgi:hypothetical protein